MKLKISKACDLGSISVFPPHTRRSSLPPSVPQSSQLRSQPSQQSFSQGISSQHALFSQISQNSLDEIVTTDQILQKTYLFSTVFVEIATWRKYNLEQLHLRQFSLLVFVSLHTELALQVHLDQKFKCLTMFMKPRMIVAFSLRKRTQMNLVFVWKIVKLKPKQLLLLLLLQLLLVTRLLGKLRVSPSYSAGRRPTGISFPNSAPSSYNSIPPPLDSIEMAKQRAQEIVVHLTASVASAGAELKRPRVENGSGGGFDYEKGFSSAHSPWKLPWPVELVGTTEQIAKAEQLINNVLAEAEAGGSGMVSRRMTGHNGSERKEGSALPIQVERKKASALPIQVERKEASTLPIQIERKKTSTLPIQIERKEASTLPIQIERKEASALPIQIERKEASHFRFKSNGKKHRTSDSTRTNGLLNHCPNLHLRNFNPKCRFSHLLKEKEKSRENIKVSRIHDCILECAMCAYAPNMSIVCVSELLKFVMNVGESVLNLL
ncbi:hypothetical protein F3Y22_tig00013285pilonHSYRG00317 [Hibiscus syriacus]|uniref:Uncharacterized protein n=1 Tax=Hibiscus syriacus TaxID=106335 RepID=A0A6A3C1S9_HIBSY|nr:hypothetical protein F3Y22_tig00013285pilonHSYRG00317 [Hibiscus syriacus]